MFVCKKERKEGIETGSSYKSVMKSLSLHLHAHRKPGYWENSVLAGFLLVTGPDKRHVSPHLHVLEIMLLTKAKNDLIS